MTGSTSGERQRRVLLAEGTAPVRRFLGKVLQRMGHDVIEIADAAELASNEGGYDLIVANAALLGPAAVGDAIAALRKRAGTAPDVPVIVLYEGGDEVGHVRAAGRAAYLARSTSLLEVVATVSELLFPEEIAQRAYGRAFGGFEVEFAPKAGAGRAVGLVYNVSRTGAFVETTRLPAEGAELALVLRLPDHQSPLELRSKVVRVSAPGEPGTPSGFGVVFVDLDAARAATLEQWVSSRLLK